MNASIHDDLIGAALFLGIYLLYLLPALALWRWRHVRYIKVRGVPHVLRIIVALSAGATANTLGLFDVAWGHCRTYEIMSTSLAMGTVLPFLELYKHLYNCYRYGVNESSQVPSEKARSRPDYLQWLAKIYVQKGSWLSRLLQVLQILCISASIVCVFVMIPPDIAGDSHMTPEDCFKLKWTGKYLYVGYFSVGGAYSTLCVLVGFAVVREFKKVSTLADHLGIRRLVFRTNSRLRAIIVIIAGGVMASHLISGFSLLVPTALYVGCCWVLIFDLCIAPLWHVWNHRHDLLVTRNILDGREFASEFDLLETFISSTEGYSLLLPFFKAELCVEILLFIREVSAFEANFADHASTSAPTPFLTQSESTPGTQHSDDGLHEEPAPTAPSTESFIRMKIIEALRIYDKFVRYGAPHEINSESTSVAACRAILEDQRVSDMAASFKAQRDPGRRLSMKRKRATDYNKVAPDSADPKQSNDGLGAKAASGGVFPGAGGGENLVPTDIFGRLKMEQLELMLMDTFTRFCQTDPKNESAWTKFCETQREMERLQQAAALVSATPKRSNTMSSTVSASKPHSSILLHASD